MHQRDSGFVGRAETRAAKDAERQHAAAIVWAEIEEAKQKRDTRTAQLRATRLARSALPLS